MGEADARDRRRREELVQDRAPVEGGERAENDAEAEAEQGGGDGEDERVPEGVEHVPGHGRAGDDGDAEVPLEEPAEPPHVLDVDGLVEAQPGPELIRHLLRRLGWDQQIGGVAGRQLDEEEDDDRNAEQDGNRVEQPSQRVGPHGSSDPSSRRRSCWRRPERSDHFRSTSVKSWNQLWALAKPVTRFVIARGLASCTMKRNGGSSTSCSCAFRVSASISLGSVDRSILTMAPSKISFFQFPQFWPLGAEFADRYRAAIRETSEVATLKFIASDPRAWGPVGAARKATSIVLQSTTSNAMSNPHCFMLCCRNSFIGSG